MLVMLGAILIELRAFQVLFLAIHDWVPLGRLNDTAAVRKEIPARELFITTLIQTAFFAVGLFFSICYFHHKYPRWLIDWLWITYGILFVGEIQAWWIPYFLKPIQSERRGIKECLETPTPFFRSVMESPQTPRTFSFTLPRSERYSFLL
jgi:hypothetical protein